MTPLFLQDALVEDMERTLSGLRPDGKPFRVFSQNLPPRKEEGDTSIFPFCRVLLGDGDDEDDAFQDVVLVFCIRDNNENMQGYRDLMNAIQRTRERFKKNPEIDGRYLVEKRIRWALPEDIDQFPTFYGTVLLRVQIPGIDLDSDNV